MRVLSVSLSVVALAVAVFVLFAGGFAPSLGEQVSRAATECDDIPGLRDDGSVNPAWSRCVVSLPQEGSGRWTTITRPVWGGDG